MIPLCCQVKTAAASLCNAWHFFRCEAVWVEAMLLSGVLQASKVISGISVLRMKLDWVFGYSVFSFLDVHIVVFWSLFWVFAVVDFIYFLPVQFV